MTDTTDTQELPDLRRAPGSDLGGEITSATLVARVTDATAAGAVARRDVGSAARIVVAMNLDLTTDRLPAGWTSRDPDERDALRR